MKNIIITGGELFNKGAQAMLFVTVDELKKRFPNHHIYVLSERDNKRPETEKALYAFDFLGWYPGTFAKAQNRFFLRLGCLFKHYKEFRQCEKIYRNTDLMIDISGYALGTIWSNNCNKLYLNNLRFAKEFHIPVYLMPQSFGPFNFEEQDRNDIAEEIKELLPYCSVICAREQDSFDELQEKYHLHNLMLKHDLVLNNKSIDIKNIYCTVPESHMPVISGKSAAVIPNIQLEKINDRKTLTGLYIRLIREMETNGYRVYLISHSSGDRSINQEIKKYLADDGKVHLIDQELSCLEFSNLIKNFDFMIASRYHAIVHAYKTGIPCLVLGWASKYKNIASLFHQEQYLVDYREEINEEEITGVLESLIRQYKNEKEVIKENLIDIQKVNVFDIIGKEYKRES